MSWIFVLAVNTKARVDADLITILQPVGSLGQPGLDRRKPFASMPDGCLASPDLVRIAC